jgi:hypothetical protein
MIVTHNTITKIKYSFLTGWYNIEHADTNWWRWSSGISRIAIQAPRNVDIIFSGQIMSSALPRNIQIIANNNKPVTTIKIKQTGFQEIPLIILHLTKGTNIYTLKADGKPIQQEKDPRKLSFALQNLQIYAK